MELAVILAGRGAIAGLGTGAMLGAMAKIIDRAPDEAIPEDRTDQSNHPVASLNGTAPVSGALGTKPRIGSR
jgi:hypothetical protein